MSAALDFLSAIIDEIALEGLDGITIEALWLRLELRPEFTFPLDDFGRNHLWSLIPKHPHVEFFLLPEPRKPLIIFNRYEFVDPHLGIVLEPTSKPEDIYPHELVNDVPQKVKGSCKQYNTRENITQLVRECSLSLPETLERWNSTLVMVASQSTREYALIGGLMDPYIEMSPIRFCILERIGRARYHGEITQGKASLQDVGEDSKSLYYHRKFFLSQNLITKQVHHQKTGIQNMSGSLLHLMRFYVERQSKTLIFTHRVVSMLRERPNFLADYEEIRKQLGADVIMRKLFKTPHFRRFVKFVSLPYRELYPEAKTREWKRKANDLEKTIRALQLINPDLDDSAIWIKDEEADLDQEEIIDKELPHQSLLHDRSILHQAFQAVDRAGPEGVSQVDVTAILSFTRVQGRSVCRSLLRLGLVSTFMSDYGRQRVTKYISNRYIKDSQLANQFKTEKDKMFSLTGGSVKSKKGTAMVKARDSADVNSTRGKKKRKSTVDLDSGHAKRLKQVDESVLEVADTTPADAVDEVAHNAEESVADQMNSIETTFSEVVDTDFGLTTDVQGFVEKLSQSNQQFSKETPNVTYRLLKRANQIIEAVQKHKVIDDLTKLNRMINDVEEKEGYVVKMDKKSLLRMLLKLNRDKSIKFFRIHLKSGEKEKILNFVCQPDILRDHPIIQSVIEQEKLKFFILSRDKMAKVEVKPPPVIIQDESSPLFNEQVARSTSELKAMTAKKKDNTFTYDRNAGKRYGLCPKFIRMRTLHQLLFYIVRDYRGEPDLNQASAFAAFQDGGAQLTQPDKVEMPTAYLNELSWKTFIPPLPAQPGWPAGWTVICDLLLRIPLSVFVRVFNITYKVPRMEEYLSHPTRQHYLLKSLPLLMRNNLLVGRKYIFSCHEVLQRLCYVGVAQFGPQRLKEKDQVFVYVNQHAELLDTIVSKPAYHQVSEGGDYPVHTHHFSVLDDVDKYWYQLWNICLHTRLGGRLCMAGKDIVLEAVDTKPAMMEAVRVRLLDEAPLLDNGQVPGDRRGAAGLDSSLFSHLKRNWNWTNQHSNEARGIDKSSADLVENLRQRRLDSLKPQPIRFSDMLSPIPSKRLAAARMIARKVGAKKAGLSKINPLEPTKKRKQHAVVRSFTQKKPKTYIRPWYDDVDHKAEESMTRRRVKWSEDEDNLLLLCKVASVYICPNPRNQLISFLAVRDVCHAAMPSTRNKTSRAHQRRIMVMMKNKTTVKNVALHLEEVKQDEFIRKYFRSVVSDARQGSGDFIEMEKTICDKFTLLVAILRKKFNRKSLLNNADRMLHKTTTFYEDLIPDTHYEITDNFDVVRPPISMKKKGSFQEAREVSDIQCSTVSSIVHSTLCCHLDKTSFMYQLFKIYQQYPDNLLRLVMAKLRTDQMVSLRKNYVQRLHKAGNYLPVSSLPYQLSVTYFYILQTNYEHELYSESLRMNKRLLSLDQSGAGKEPGAEQVNTDATTSDTRSKHCASLLIVGASDDLVKPTDSNCHDLDLDGGSAAALVELFCLDLVVLDIEIPDNIVVLDPRISETDDAYIKILARYQEIVRDITKDIPPGAADIINKPTFLSAAEKEGEDTVLEDQNNAIVRTTACKFATSALRKFAPSRNDDTSDSEDGSDSEEPRNIVAPLGGTTQYTIARAASRIALFSMRDDFLMRGRSGDIHTHDFLVVNSCKVRCHLRESDSAHRGKFIFQGRDSRLPELMTSDEVDIPLISQHRNVMALMEDFNKVVDDIKSTLVVPEGSVTEEDARIVFQAAEPSNEAWEQALALVELIQTRMEIGATLKELKEQYTNLSCRLSLLELLQLLTKSWYIVRVGITTPHFVYHKFLHPWLLHSYKIVRLELEKMTPELKCEAATYIGDCMRRKLQNESQLEGDSTAVGNKRQCSEVQDKMPTCDKKVDVLTTLNIGDKNVKETTESENMVLVDDSVEALESGKGAGVLQYPPGELTAEKIAGDNDDSNTETIRVLIRPWVRVDGSFNRRVLDRFCGSVLGVCMNQPGLSVSKIQERFSPALQPVHTLEIIEILIKLNCLQLLVVTSDRKPTLFSKASTVQLKAATGVEDESLVVVKVSVDAVTRLGAFIGEKLYKKDFLKAI